MAPSVAPRGGGDGGDDGAGGALRRLALHDRHRAAGARFAPFAGWEMPLQYAGIVSEHEAVRGRAGVFDVSHLGRVEVRGPGAGAALRSVTTYDVLRLRPGRAHYSLYCNEDGGIADDVFVYRVDEQRWLMAQNAANHEAGLARLRGAAAATVEAVTAEAVTVEDATARTVMLAVQGPQAIAALRSTLGGAVDALRPRRCADLPWRSGALLVARTGYTGEDGAECIVGAPDAGALWDALIAEGVRPAGLGARDTLRLEAALPLHGQDIDASTNPYEAGLGWTVSLDDGAPFTGREALVRLASEPPRRRLSHLRLRERGVPRRGYPVIDPSSPDRRAVATLTSGAFAPALREGIGMAYLPVELAEPGTELAVEIRGRATPALVVPRPFYRRGE